jgi:hypothetical protein
VTRFLARLRRVWRHRVTGTLAEIPFGRGTALVPCKGRLHRRRHAQPNLERLRAAVERAEARIPVIRVPDAFTGDNHIVAVDERKRT